MKRYIVGAFDNGRLDHYASTYYGMLKEARLYCLDCNVKCTPYTGLEYRVVEEEDAE